MTPRAVEFARLRERIEGGEDAALADMIAMALGAEGTIGLWAKRYLMARFGVAVMENDHEAAGQAGTIQG